MLTNARPRFLSAICSGSAAGLVAWTGAGGLWVLYRTFPNYNAEFLPAVLICGLGTAAFYLFDKTVPRNTITEKWRNRLRLGLAIVVGAFFGQLLGELIVSLAGWLNYLLHGKLLITQSYLPLLTGCAGMVLGWLYGLNIATMRQVVQIYIDSASHAAQINALATMAIVGGFFYYAKTYNIISEKDVPPPLLVTISLGLAAVAALQAVLRVADKRNQLLPLIVVKYAAIGAGVVGVPATIYLRGPDPTAPGPILTHPALLLAAGAMLGVALRFQRSTVSFVRAVCTDGARFSLLAARVGEQVVSLAAKLGVLALAGFAWNRYWINGQFSADALVTAVAYGGLGLVVLWLAGSMASTLRRIASAIRQSPLGIPADRVAPGGRRTATFDEARRAGRDGGSGKA